MALTRSKSFASALGWLSGLGFALVVIPPAAAQERIIVNCGQSADPPLVRKFGVANSCAVTLDRYRRDAAALAAIKPAALRLELGWGFSKVGWSKPLVTGSAGNVQYAWEEVDELARLCETHGLEFDLSYCYTPPVFQRDDWYSPPASVRQWAAAVREYAYHYRIAGQPLGAHEIWNRTDSSIYFAATRGTYLRLFKEAAGALREADADAVIGGPVIAGQGEWVVPFVGYVQFERLPLDFFSFLAVSPSDEDQTWGTVQKRLLDVRKALADTHYMDNTEIRLMAFNPLTKSQLRYDPNPGAGQPALAAEMLGYLEQFLLQPDLTQVNWSQFQDSGITNDLQGLLDFAGNPRPAFGALAIYADMPVDRVSVAGPPPLRVMASSSPTKAAAVVWNPTPEPRTTIVEFQQLPFSAGSLGIQRIDAQNSVKFLRTGDWEIQPGDSQAIAGQGVEWRGEIPPQGVVYFSAANGAASTQTNQLPATRVLRLHRWFRDRYGKSYADFDRRTLTARLGMDTDTRGTAIIGANLVNCPTNLEAIVETSGNPRKLETGSTLAVRVDIMDRGTYSTGILFHAGLYDVSRTEVPQWGTRRAPDKVVTLQPGALWDLDLTASVPRNWGRRAIVTFIQRDTGPGSRSKFQLTASRK